MRFQKLMWRNMIRSIKNKKASVLHYSIDSTDYFVSFSVYSLWAFVEMKWKWRESKLNITDLIVYRLPHYLKF